MWKVSQSFKLPSNFKYFLLLFFMGITYCVTYIQPFTQAAIIKNENKDKQTNKQTGISKSMLAAET